MMSKQNLLLGAASEPRSCEEQKVRAPSSLAKGYEGLRLPVAALLDDVRSMYNVGAFFRAADGVGLERLCLGGITADPPKKAISKTALGAEETVAWEHDWDAVEMAKRLRQLGFGLAAIETSEQAVDLFDWQPEFPICVAFGNEVTGLKPELLAMADTHAHPHAGSEKFAQCRDGGRDRTVRTAAQISHSQREHEIIFV
jgi:tRNA G18 (ribose-2'-O)-methylase SpoU